MSKKLSEMSLEELWQLFPVILTEHQSDWNEWYKEEKMLQGILPEENVARMSHIGSIEHFYGHLEIECCGGLGLCSVEYKKDVEQRTAEIVDFCKQI